ncbi:3-hydroxyisobutyrate dehydrogenase [Agrobacterium albertimagni AOL15]|uniref:3-hydroxyisobutyrate dehydrogenase n=1 Tax=Agrobacterium albertimagni AOL15 TaxID=1156935 RepID=K2Q722_9HYPH|nr:3-hydroxyisobutyrate dehydrogenase [Agrobacterium albertimagni]EKF61045.1 3-hydroxyisobutyrate dehydrogenase [Agrobacterium albertimagni AOL15]
MLETIAFIGLGNMGGPMAANLVKAGYRVRGFDLSEPARKAATDNGITLCESAAQAVDGASIVITMLPAGHHVLSVWSELIGVVDQGTLLIDCSTIDVDSARKCHALADGAGCLSLDAPVSGGTAGASAGTLTFMVGGEAADALQRGRPILEAMGRRVVHCGSAGAGQAAKICNNMVLGITMAGVCEAFVLGEKLGLSHQALFDVASTSSGQCWAISTNCPVPGPVPTSPANRDYKPGFAAALMLKDMRLSQDAAKATGAATALGAHATALYELFDQLGHGGEDFSSIINYIRDKTT